MKQTKSFLTVLALIMAIATPSFGFTEADVSAAGADAAKLTAIARHTDSNAKVRSLALAALPTESVSAILNSLENDIQAELNVRDYLVLLNKMPDDQWDRTIVFYSAVFQVPTGATHLRKRVSDLSAAGRTGEAIIAARRLYAMSGAESSQLNAAIDVISGTIKKKVISDGGTVGQGISALNQYLKDVQDGRAEQNAFAATAIPAGPDNVTALESSSHIALSITALLYQGKWDAAEAKADAFLADANASSLSVAIDLKSRVINGRAGSPTAANSFIASLK